MSPARPPRPRHTAAYLTFASIEPRAVRVTPTSTPSRPIVEVNGKYYRGHVFYDDGVECVGWDEELDERDAAELSQCLRFRIRSFHC